MFRRIFIKKNKKKQKKIAKTIRFGVFLLKKNKKNARTNKWFWRFYMYKITKKNARTISSSIFFLHNRIRIEGDSIQICFDSI
jgi:hypothetical protein